MINALEEIGAISRKNMYRVECGKTCSGEGGCEIILEDDTVFRMPKREAGPDRPGWRQKVRLSGQREENIEDNLSQRVDIIPYLFQKLFCDRRKDLVFLPHKIHLVLERRIKRNKKRDRSRNRY